MNNCGYACGVYFKNHYLSIITITLISHYHPCLLMNALLALCVH